MVKEHVLPQFTQNLLTAFGELTVYFRCLDLVLADSLAHCLNADTQPRGRRHVDVKSFDWKLRKLKELAAEEPEAAAEFEVLSILEEARRLGTARNDLLHGNIRIDTESGELQVVRSRTRNLTTTAIHTLCNEIDTLATRAFCGLAKWAREVRGDRPLAKRIREILEI